jgi:hypothetical protein
MACTSVLLPPYGYYVRLLFGKGKTFERDITLSQQNNNFRMGDRGRLKYLGWDRSPHPDYLKKSLISSLGYSWGTGVTHTIPQQWKGLLKLKPQEWAIIHDIWTIQQERMRSGTDPEDLLIYDHRIMLTEQTATRPNFDNVQVLQRSGAQDYWALFRTEIKSLTISDLMKDIVTNDYRYHVEIELVELIPTLVALPV